MRIQKKKKKSRVTTHTPSKDIFRTVWQDTQTIKVHTWLGRSEAKLKKPLLFTPMSTCLIMMLNAIIFRRQNHVTQKLLSFSPLPI